MSGAAAEIAMPAVRGRLMQNRDLAGLTWLRVGGPADWLFMPADEDDLAAFMGALPRDVAIFAMGVGSNLIVRDGGIRGVVIRLGRAFGDIRIEGPHVVAGAAARDSRVAVAAAEAGRDLTFLRTIPGSVGGALRMNAGCYGTYVNDVLVSARAVTRTGERVEIAAAELDLGYRRSALPDGWVLTEARFAAPPGDPDALAARMDEQMARRDESQPTEDLTAGSTFRNPAGYSSTGRADDVQDLKAWKVIDDAGLRGARRGGAMMSEKHANFLTNVGCATAADLEGLGEEVIARVERHSGIRLEWEILRVGERIPDEAP